MFGMILDKGSGLHHFIFSTDHSAINYICSTERILSSKSDLGEGI